jgi:hypothetical protein
MSKTVFQQLSDLLTSAIDTGNRDYGDEVYAQALHNPELTEEERAELFIDYNNAVEAGEI